MKMKAKELIAELSKNNPELEVYVGVYDLYPDPIVVNALSAGTPRLVIVPRSVFPLQFRFSP